MMLSRRGCLLAGLGGPLLRAFSAQAMSVTWDGDDIHIAARQLHFLQGKPLERLKDGAAVVFLSQVTLSTDANSRVFRRVPERFVVSYDLWEEKFSVTRLGGAPRAVSHLAAAGAEQWCLENLAVSALGLEPERPFWLHFDLRAADTKEEAGVVGEPGINLTRLIELFSRPPGAQQPHWTLDAGPLRLADLRRTQNRGTRSG